MRNIVEAVRNFVEGEEAEEYQNLLREKQKLFGLEDWRVGVRWATGNKLREMRENEWVACIRSNPSARRATIFLDKKEFEKEDIDKEIVFEHELAHLIVNPY